MMFFLDFEASSLNEGSFPVEIGWASTAGARESHLIRPHESWQDWSEASYRIHGISRAELEQDGEPAEQVARRAYEVLGQAPAVLSDNPSYDQYWLDRLLALIGFASAVPVQHVQVAYRAIARDQATIQEAMTAEAGRQHVRHRALPDAEALLWIFERLHCG